MLIFSDTIADFSVKMYFVYPANDYSLDNVWDHGVRCVSAISLISEPQEWGIF